MFFSPILIQNFPQVNRLIRNIEFLFDFLLTSTFVRFIIQIEQKFHRRYPIMTTFGFIITILGAGSLAVNIMHLIDRLDQPKQRRRRTA